MYAKMAWTKCKKGTRVGFPFIVMADLNRHLDSGSEAGMTCNVVTLEPVILEGRSPDRNRR